MSAEDELLAYIMGGDLPPAPPTEPAPVDVWGPGGAMEAGDNYAGPLNTGDYASGYTPPPPSYTPAAGGGWTPPSPARGGGYSAPPPPPAPWEMTGGELDLLNFLLSGGTGAGGADSALRGSRMAAPLPDPGAPEPGFTPAAPPIGGWPGLSPSGPMGGGGTVGMQSVPPGPDWWPQNAPQAIARAFVNSRNLPDPSQRPFVPPMTMAGQVGSASGPYEPGMTAAPAALPTPPPAFPRGEGGPLEPSGMAGVPAALARNPSLGIVGPREPYLLPENPATGQYYPEGRGIAPLYGGNIRRDVPTEPMKPGMFEWIGQQISGAARQGFVDLINSDNVKRFAPDLRAAGLFIEMQQANERAIKAGLPMPYPNIREMVSADYQASRAEGWNPLLQGMGLPPRYPDVQRVPSSSPLNPAAFNPSAWNAGVVGNTTQTAEPVLPRGVLQAGPQSIPPNNPVVETINDIRDGLAGALGGLTPPSAPMPGTSPVITSSISSGAPVQPPAGSGDGPPANSTGPRAQPIGAPASNVPVAPPGNVELGAAIGAQVAQALTQAGYSPAQAAAIGVQTGLSQTQGALAQGLGAGGIGPNRAGQPGSQVGSQGQIGGNAGAGGIRDVAAMAAANARGGGQPNDPRWKRYTAEDWAAGRVPPLGQAEPQAGAVQGPVLTGDKQADAAAILASWEADPNLTNSEDKRNALAQLRSQLASDPAVAEQIIGMQNRRVGGATPAPAVAPTTTAGATAATAARTSLPTAATEIASAAPAQIPDLSGVGNVLGGIGGAIGGVAGGIGDFLGGVGGVKDNLINQIFGIKPPAAATGNNPGSTSNNPARAPWPVFGAKEGTITSDVNQDISAFGGSANHQGWDIPGEMGAPLIAIFDGTVIDKGKDAIYGNYVTIQQPDTNATVKYGHMMDPSGFRVGEPVKIGNVVGSLGNTGKSIGPHVHFEVRDSQGGLIDPRRIYPGVNIEGNK